MVLRQVDIKTWESEAARQAHREFGLDALPTVVVFGKDGGQIASVRGVNPSAIEAAVRKGLQ